ncbi:chromate transporter [Ideonella livida]|uniref:Chromate transporter n=1 Tax=Ideonella livida TaxID=2707176 RepID=A0A7C9PIZ8_9BURK|nr:chromate transporter [Ideonella livida]NDY93116.1 chromate transporter [Ideonella livida]
MTVPPPPSAPAPLDPQAAPQQPGGPGELFTAFTWTALQGFGGVLAVVQRELVERRGWYSNAGFVQDWAVAQVLPGPNVCNLALMLGDRTHGWRGALAALAGLLVAPLLILLTLAVLVGGAASHPAWQAPLQGALRGMGAVAAGLIAGTSLKLFMALRGHPLRWAGAGAVAACAFAGLVVAGWPLTALVPGLGTVACALTAWRLHRADLAHHAGRAAAAPAHPPQDRTP